MGVYAGRMQSSPLRALTHYRILPQLVAVPSLLVAAAGRIPYSLIPLGAVTGMTWATGSIAVGGLTTAIIALSSAVASPLLGRLSDRIGTPLLLRVFWPLSTVATSGLLLATLMAWDDWRLYAVAVATGATMIPVGALTRARWVMLRTDPRTLSTAFSYETMVDELMFVVGPILVGITSVLAGWAPLALAVALIVVAVGLFTWDEAQAASSLEETQPRSPSPTASLAEGGHSSSRKPPIVRVLWSVLPVIGAMIATGTIFGATQTGITERAIAAGTPSQGGLWYGLMGIGSAIISLLAVLIPARITTPMRIGAAATLLLATFQAASHLDSLPTTGALLFVSGFGIGTILVTCFSSAERLCPPGGVAVAMTAMPAAITIGVSIGSLVGGQAATYGSHVAFHVATLAAGTALLCAMWLHLRLRRLERR